MANLLIVLILIPWATWASDDRVRDMLIGFIVSNLVFVFFSLVPLNLTHEGKPLLSDGINIARHIKITNAEGELMRLQSRSARDMPDERKIMQKLSVNDAIHRFGTMPDNFACLALLVDKLTAAKDPRQFEYVSHFISMIEARTETITRFLDAYLTNQLVEGTIPGHRQFDHYSALLLEKTNQSVTAKGTRGSVLVDLGYLDEGKAMLQEVLGKDRQLSGQNIRLISFWRLPPNQREISSSREVLPQRL